MTILVFPDNPSIGQKVTIDEREWTWDGERWLKIGGTGYQGSEGYFGSTGQQGPVGYRGSKGEDGVPGGPTGFTGSKGDTGDRGIDGYTGSSGAFAGVGFTGSRGTVGYDGSRGAVGYTGSKGDRGFTGSRGLQGITGFVGSFGYTGSLGYAGSTGLGETGYTGSTGFTGSRGPQGVAGAPRLVEFLYGNGSNTIFDLQYTAVLPMHILVMVNGLVQMPYIDYTVDVDSITFAAPPSDQADIEIRYFDQAGFTGSTGDTGDQGPTGHRGSVGYTGSRGDVGYIGSPGVQGPEGNPGPPGGADGYTGSRGYTGSVGFRGSMGFAGAPKHSQQEVGNGVDAIFELDYDVENATHILVMVNGLVQLPVIDYDLAGSKFIVFTNIPEDQSDIEIRFFQATGFDGSRGEVGYRGSAGYTGSKGPPGDPGGDSGYTGSVGYTGSAGVGIPGPVGAPHTSQVFQTDGVANTFTLREVVFDPRHIFVMVNGLVQLPGVDYNLIGVDLVDDEVPPETPYDQDIEYVTTTGSTEIQFAVPPPINSDVEIRYFKVVGYAGSTGDVGYRGSAGTDGTPGYTGSVGYKGSTGDVGFRGSAGFQGSQGTTSVFIGPNPPENPDDGTVWWDSDNGILNFYYGDENVWVGVSEGAQGYAGSQGPAGPAGGYTGSQGEIGYAGSNGIIGYDGSVGFTGSEGVGYTGSQGLPGEAAAVGYTGSQGTEGYSGSVGYTGSEGAGYTGSAGFVGSAGQSGDANSYGVIGIASLGSANLVATKPNDSFTLIPGSGISFYSNGTALTINSTATGSGGVGLSPRLSNTVTTAVGTANTTIGLAKTFAILKIATTGSAWVRVYADTSSRTADLARLEGDEPNSDAGVIAEVITSGAETVRFTPAAIGWNDDNPTSNNIYLRITNNTAAPINTTITYVPLES